MTTQYADIHIKVNPTVKADAEKVLSEIGISMSDLINMTLRRVVFEQGIPFSTKLKPSLLPEITTSQELEQYLETVVSEDDGVYYSADEVWNDLEQHKKTIKGAKRVYAKV